MPNILLKLILLFYILALSACNPSNPQSQADKTGKTVLYNPYLMKLVGFDAATKHYAQWTPADNQFQYSVPNSDSLYIDGNSLTNHFSLLQVVPATGNVDKAGGADKAEQTYIGNDKIETVYKFAPNIGVFPIGFIDNQLYFIRILYTEDGSEQAGGRSIALYDVNTKQVKIVNANLGQITTATIAAPYIYYTRYNQQADYFDLLRIELGGQPANNAPELVQSELGASDLYSKHNMPSKGGKDNNNNITICTSDNGHNFIQCGDEQWAQKATNTFSSHYLIQMMPDAAGFGLRITDTTTHQSVFYASGISGYKVVGATVIVGTASGLVEFTLL